MGISTKLGLTGAVVAAGLAVSAGGVFAATLTFSNFTSTNAAQLNPLVTVSDTLGGFIVTVEHTGSDDGHLNLIAFDLGSAVVASSDVTNVTNDMTALQLVSPCPGGQGPASGRYCFGTSVPLGGNSNNLNGLGGLPTFEAVLAFRNSDAIADAGSKLSFQIANLGGTLGLTDFLGVGLRYQSSNNGDLNGGASDKLFATADTVEPPPPPVPLPAASFLMLGAIGGLAGLRRFKARKG